ncbi:MAG: nuclear transport factor 2 family protein [Planctomycetota bacterium]|jgi:ketosteroid isomerase-like protein
MKISLARGLVVITLIPALAAVTWAQDRAADHEALRVMRAAVAQAVSAHDADALAALLDDPFSITMVDQTHITSVEELRDHFARLFEGDDAVLESVRIEPEADVLSRFPGESLAVNHGNSRDTYTLTRGGEVVLDSRWTGMFRKTDAGWKITALHAGVNMLDNPVLSLAERIKFWWGGGGLIVGVVLGSFLRRRPRS